MKINWIRRRKVFSAGICIMLALAMIITMIPMSGSVVYAAAGKNEQKLSDAKSVFSLDKQEPSEMDKLPDNVYDVDQDQPFLLSEQNELAVITTNGGTAGMTRLDNINMDVYYRNTEYDQTLMYGTNVANSESSSSIGSSDMDVYNNLDCLQSVSLDWDGTGRREYIASVGFTAGMYSYMLQNASTGEIVISGHYSEHALGQENAPFWARDNYLAITAGDYDGDGRDSFIIYTCGVSWFNTRDILLEEIKPNGSGSSITDIYDMKPVFKNTDFMNDTEYKNKPTISLTTGDFNGDGRDQLAWSAGFYNNSDNVRDGYMDYKCDNLEQFATAVGVLSNESGSWTCSDPVYLYDQGSDYTLSEGLKTYPLTIMHAGQIAAGDVNNDGIDEIIAAGYMSLTKDTSPKNYARAIYSDGKLTKVSHICDWDPERLVSSVIYYDSKGYKRTQLTPFQMKQPLHYTFNTFCKDEDWVHARTAIACGKLNGDNSPETVFIGGGIYNFDDFIPDEKSASYFMNSTDCGMVIDTSADPVNSSVNWIKNVTAGNFNGNNAGREQFIFTFWQKHYGENQYAATIGSIAGVDFDDKKDAKGNIESYGPPAIYANGWFIDEASWSLKPIDDKTNKKASCLFSHAGINSPLNGVPVAVDIDDDGVLGKFSRRGYVYTDPEVVAVLEAAPYFKDIYNAGGYVDYGETTYSISTGYRTGTSRSDRFGFEVGFAGEASGPGVKVALEAGYSQDWSRTYEKNYTVTSTVTYAAQNHDAVVISRIPVIIYTYDLYDQTTDTWIENGYNVRVPLAPRYRMLSIKEYNKFVDQYNKMMKAKPEYLLNKIVEGEDIPENHEGNPKAYWDKWVLAGEGHKGLSKEDVELSHSSGSTSFEYSTEAEASESRETSYGVHFGLTLQTGSDYAVGDAWAGAYSNVDYEHTTGTSTSTIDTKNSGGKVQNIDKDELTDAGYREGLIDQYGFKWEFGKWTRKLMKEGNNVPFYGYIVKECMMPKTGLIFELDHLKKKGDLSVTMPYKSTAVTGSAIKPVPVVRHEDKILKAGKDYKLSYKDNVEIGTAAVVITGIGNYGGKITKKFTITKKPVQTVKVGTNQATSAGTVKVTSLRSKTVAFTKAKNSKSVTVPATVKMKDGKTYKVTQINGSAFKGSKIQTITISKNINKISKNAFKGARATKLIVKTKLLKKAKVRGCLNGSKIKTIQVKLGSASKKYVRAYRKIFTRANAGKKVTVK